MGELLPETWNLKPGDEANQQRLLARRKKPVTELKTWVQCFAIYVGVVSLRHPEVIADMMAYMVMIVKAADEYAGLAWVRYDEAFRSQAAAKKDAQWSKVNPSLFAQCFTGRAHNQAHCDLCLSSLHSTQDCVLGNTPLSDTTAKLQSVEASLLAISNNLRGPHRMPQRKPAGLCRAWNGGSCTHYPCKYKHACTHCMGPHSACRCPQQSDSKAGGSRAKMN